MTIKYHSSTVETLMEIGNRIKRLRLSSGVTQAELSKHSGVSIRTIVNLEAGKDFSMSNFIAVLRSLNALEELDMVLKDSSFAMDINRRTQKERQRARKSKYEKTDNVWKWGDEK